jgi:aminoglycoside phosphotransferase family enzyme/predicted kinase
MITEGQSAVVELLGASSTHGGAPVERIETHSAIVFLAGTRAWKLKRAVRFDYLDFSTAARRREMCEAEVRLNRRTAPSVYRGVVPITRDDSGSLSLGGQGTAVDWVVEMARFDQASLLDRLAARRQLDVAMMPPLATAIASFHRHAEPRRDHGGAAGMRWVVEGNASGFAEHDDVLDPAACERLTDRTRAELDRHEALLEARRDAGLVRQCHGDLHLRNIVWLDGRPTIFDGVEFNDEIACIDVLYDLAFLLMDLWRRELPQHANAVWNGYLAQTADLDGLALMPLFLSCRAAVRAKTSATAARLQSDARQAEDLRQLARTYLVLADRFLTASPPALVAVGGFSGSGKSTLARALASEIGPAPGAVVIRSDEIRKQLCGIDALERLGPESYTEDVSTRVYATVADRARRTIAAHHSAIADAVYARLADRQAIERVASDAGVAFVGIWLDAPEATLVDRATRRVADASDADAAVIRQQRTQDIGAMRWHRLDASRSFDDVLDDARREITLATEAHAPAE